MTASFIAGDWGTSRLRLYLCAGEAVIDRKVGPGAVGVHEPHGALLAALAAPWLAEHGPLPILLCGMVGSRNGWVEAPYAPAPADCASLASLLVRFKADDLSVAIVPGVVAHPPDDAPDVMRGEETQIMGALALSEGLKTGRKLLALPGTHTKWVVIEDGRIVRFKTAMTGELFALLRDHSTLIKVGGEDLQAPSGAFAAGLAAEQSSPVGLLHQLFAVRSRQLIDGWGGAYALDYLSGLLIAADVDDAITAFDPRGAPVVLVGDPLLTDRYGQAMAERGLETEALSGEACALAGLRAIFQPQT